MAKKNKKRNCEREQITNEEIVEKTFLMFEMINKGITPEEYAEFYKMKSVIDDFYNSQNSDDSEQQSNIWVTQ